MIRQIAAIAILALTTLPTAVSQASLLGRDSTATTAPKGKSVKITLRNRTAAPMDLLIEDKPITIAANGDYELKAPEGTHVYGSDKTVKVLLTRDLNGTTCSFR